MQKIFSDINLISLDTFSHNQNSNKRLKSPNETTIDNSKDSVVFIDQVFKSKNILSNKIIFND